MEVAKLDNLDIVLRAVKDYFTLSPNGELKRQDVSVLTGIEIDTAHPALQLLCGGPSSPYDKGPRAESLRGILNRNSRHKNTSFTLSSKGRLLFSIDFSEPDREPLSLLESETIADILLTFAGKTFTTIDFVQRFESERPSDYAILVERYGSGGAGSGLYYSIRSYLANSLSRYARKWDPSSDLPHLSLEAIVSVPTGEGTEKVGSWSSDLGSETLLADIVALVETKGLESTDRDQLLKARIGQGRFRQQVIDHWRCTCPVTKCNDRRVLIASHIKRWCDSDNRERLDPLNGLLLSPNVDRLFDKHLISFADSGRMLLSERISYQLLAQLGLSSDVLIELDLGHKHYLAAHRERMTMLDVAMVNSQENEE